MKKVLVVAVLALGTMTAFAQEVATEVEAVATEAVITEETVVVEVVATEEVVAEEAVIATEEVVVEEAVVATEEVVEDEIAFNEVAIAELPEAITVALEAAHPGATIAKAYANKSSQYKLDVANAEGVAVELYTDAEGNWIEL